MDKWALLCIVTLNILSFPITLCIEESNKYFPRVEHAHRGNELLHMDNFKVYSFGDEKYVRLYQTIFEPILLTPDGTPPSTTGKKGVSYVNGAQFKDIWQDIDGHVIIKTKGNAIAGSGEPLWISVGKARHQVEFLHKYATQKNPAKSPLIRSFLVKLDTVLDIMNPRHMTTEPFSTKLNMDFNVDLHTSNQFGLRSSSTEKIRANTLDGSLVTYVLDHDPSKTYESSWGKVLPDSDLRHDFNMPNEDIPGIHKVEAKLRSEQYSEMASRLYELDSIHQTRPGDHQDLIAKINEYNDKFESNMKMEDLQNAKSWAQELDHIREVNDNYYKHNDDPNYSSELKKIEAKDYTSITSDDMFNGIHDDQVKINKMNELIASSQKHKQVLKERQKLFSFVEALVKDINLKTEADPSLKRYINKYSKPGDKSGPAAGGLNLLKDAGISSDTLKKLQLGTGLQSDQIYTQYKQNILNSLKDKIPGDLNINFDVDDRMSTRVGITFTLDDVQLLQSKGLTDILMVEHKGANDMAFYDYDGNSRRGESGIKILPEGAEVVVAVSAEDTFSPNKLGSVHDVLEKRFAGNDIGDIDVYIRGSSSIDNNNIDGIVNFATDVSNKKNFKRVNVKPFGGTSNLQFDFVENAMYLIKEDSSNARTRLGTPVQFAEGIPTHNHNLFEREDVEIMKRRFGSDFDSVQREKFSGTKLFQELDPVPDSRYLFLESDGPNNKPTSADDFLLRNKKVLNGDVTGGFQPKSKYHNEIIIQLDSSPETTKASEFIVGKQEKDISKNIFFCSMDDEGTFTKIRGADLSQIDFDSSTRVHFVGHGDAQDGNLKVGGRSPEDIADHFSKRFANSAEDTHVSKFSVVACNDNVDSLAQDRALDFGNKLLKKLHEKKITGSAAVRNGKIQVDALGRKQYGEMVGSEIEWRYRQGDPNLVKLDDNGNTLYGVREKGKVRWTSDKSSIPNFDDNQKVVIITEKQGKINTIDDISKPGKLHSIAPIDEASGPLNVLDTDYLPDHPYLRDERGMSNAVMQVDGSYWGDRLVSATAEVLSDIPDKTKWFPIIETANTDVDGVTKVNIINSDTNEVVSVRMKNNAFAEYKKTCKRIAISTNKLRPLGKASTGFTGAGAVMGLGFFIQSAIQMSRAKNCKEDGTCVGNGTASNLAWALQTHAYMGLAQGSFGVITDSIEIGAIVKSFLLAKKSVNGIVSVTKSTAKFLSAANAVGKVATGVGIVGSVVSLGFSAYELHNAQTTAQKIQFGIQVGLEAASLVVSGVMLAGSIMGASFAAGPVGAAVGIVVALTTVLINGIVSLVFEFKATRSSAGLVGEYFYTVDEGYRLGGYKFEDGVLYIREHVIVTDIDIQSGYVKFDSQYIYRTWHGKTGSGKRNYFFWYKDFPKMIEDKSRAINVRKGISYSSDKRSISHLSNRISTVVLPVVPKSYISYTWKRLPFCTAMHDKGFDIIRRLENDYRFDYDFYIIPGEQIVNSISHEYIHTRVNVRLKSSVKTVYIPEYPSSLTGFYVFTITSPGPKHHVVLNKGVEIKLINQAHNRCTWILDLRNIKEQFSFRNRKINFGSETTVEVARPSQQDLFLYDSTGGFSKIDLHTGRRQIQSVDFGSSNSVESIRRYLRNLIPQLMKNQKFVKITNFKHHGKLVGNAFYEIAKNRFLYSDLSKVGLPDEFKNSVMLLAILGERAFYLGQLGQYYAVWWSYATNHQVGATFNFYCGNEGYAIKPLDVQDDYVLVSQTVENVSLIYMMQPANLTLITIDGTRENVDKLADVCFQSLKEWLPGASELRAQREEARFPGDCIYARSRPILPLVTTVEDKTTHKPVHYHFWLHMEDTHALEERNGVFCEKSPPPVATGIIIPNIPGPECVKLTLRGLHEAKDGGQAYFFFCDEDKIVYSQVNDTIAREIDIPDGVEALEYHGSMTYVRSNIGGLYSFEDSGEFTLAAVSLAFLEASSDWKSSINVLADKSEFANMIFLLGLVDVHGRKINAWFDYLENHIVMISPSLHELRDDIMYLGITNTPSLVWMFEPSHGTLLLQSTLTNKDIQDTFSSGKWMSDVKPSSREVYTGLVSVEPSHGANVIGLTQQGIILSFSDFSTVKLLGVNQTWLKFHDHRLVSDLEKLCVEFNSTDLITLGHLSLNETHTSHSWFHCSVPVLLSISVETGLEADFQGLNKELKTAYFKDGSSIIQLDYSREVRHSRKRRSTRSDLVRLSQQDQDVLSGSSLANTVGETVFLQAPMHAYIDEIPLLDDVSSLVLVAGQRDCIFNISTSVWLHYRSIIFTSAGSDGIQKSGIIVNAPYPCSYPHTSVNNDTVFVSFFDDVRFVLRGYTPLVANTTLPRNPGVVTLLICDADPMYFVTIEDRPDSESLAEAFLAPDYWHNHLYNYALLVASVVGMMMSFIVNNYIAIVCIAAAVVVVILGVYIRISCKRRSKKKGRAEKRERNVEMDNLKESDA